MGKVIFGMQASLDGFIAAGDRNLDWQIVDEELHTYYNEQTRAAGAMLHGRRTYEVMVDYWPTGDTDPDAPEYMREFARIWKTKRQIVFSRTLTDVYPGHELVKDDLPGAVGRLKAEVSGDLQLGGAELAADFRRLGLIDEYEVAVQPALLGGGIPMFPGPADLQRLELIGTRTLGSGVVILRYRVA